MVKETEGGLKVFPLVQSLFPTLLIQEAPPQTFWKHANKITSPYKALRILKQNSGKNLYYLYCTIVQ